MRNNSRSGDVPRGDDDISGRSVDDGGQLRYESSVSVAMADDGATTTIRSRLLNHKELVIEYVTRLNGRVSVIDEREEERFARASLIKSLSSGYLAILRRIFSIF